MNEDDSSRTQFWVKRWERDKLPWDLGGIPRDLVSFLTRTQATPTRVLIPGCGSGYEVKAFHEAGHEVMALDFSGPAVAHARGILGPLGDKVVQGNFFKHEFGAGRFGLVYERGFLCSLPPARWPDYAARMADLVAPGGCLVGLFLYGQEPEPPPFPLTEETAAALLGLAEIPPIRVTSLVGAGALVETIEDPESWRSPNQVELHASGAIGALLVRGESQWPRFLDGEFILYDMEPRAPAELVNQYAVVQTLDGRRLIKVIHAAGGGKWELASHNAPPEIVELLAAWPYLGTIWGHDAKTPEIAPTKSKRAKKRA